MGFWDGKSVLVTGGAGFLGSFLVEKLLERGVEESRIRIPRSNETDLRLRENCEAAVKEVDIVIHLAARVGGIGFNQQNPGMLFYDNAVMGVQLIEAARQAGVDKFVQVGTICAYPKFTSVPFLERDLWDGYPEETNAPYGLAKKMLLVQLQAYREQYGFNGIYLLPVNLYGPRDNFDPASSHVIPAIIRKVIEARDSGAESITAWGTGNASREFLYVQDAAEGVLLAAERYEQGEPVNLGSGQEISIRDLVAVIVELAGYEGEVRWDPTKPDGQPRRCLDVQRAKNAFGFEAQMPMKEGLARTIEWYESVCRDRH